LWKDANEGYLANCHITTPLTSYAADPEGARKLWALSEEMVGEKFTL